MRYRWSRLDETGQKHWLLKRNCALSPFQLACCFGALGMLSLTIATLFALQGAWLMLPFAALEVVALGVAFVVYARHAADYERIIVAPGCLVVERVTGGTLARTTCESRWVRVAYAGARREPIRLIAGSEEVVVGRFLPDDSKESLVRELRASLVGWRA